MSVFSGCMGIALAGILLLAGLVLVIIGFAMADPKPRPDSHH